MTNNPQVGSGARRLAEFRSRKVRVRCDRCQMARQYDGDQMIARCGPDQPLPDLLTKLAIAEGCYLNAATTPNGDRCKMVYVDLP